MKYKVGDIVKLRDDLDIGEEYGAVVFLYSMETLKNKALRIDSIDTEDDESAVYEIDGWWISAEMIEGLWEECKEKQDKLKLIDVLNMIAKDELKEGTKVKKGNTVYMYDKRDCFFYDEEDNFICLDPMKCLNDEVELIKPPCEDEHIVGADKTIEPTKIEELGFNKLLTTEGNVISIINKLNEVIRKINKE